MPELPQLWQRVRNNAGWGCGALLSVLLLLPLLRAAARRDRKFVPVQATVAVHEHAGLFLGYGLLAALPALIAAVVGLKLRWLKIAAVIVDGLVAIANELFVVLEDVPSAVHGPPAPKIGTRTECAFRLRSMARAVQTAAMGVGRRGLGRPNKMAPRPPLKPAVRSVVVGLVITAALSACSGGHDKKANGVDHPSPSASLPPPLTAASAAQLASELTSGQASQVARAVALPSGQPIPAGFASDMAQLKSVVIAAGSFRQSADGTATVTIDVTTPAGAVQHWQGQLIAQDGSWRLASTSAAPAGSATAGP